MQDDKKINLTNLPQKIQSAWETVKISRERLQIGKIKILDIKKYSNIYKIYFRYSNSEYGVFTYRNGEESEEADETDYSYLDTINSVDFNNLKELLTIK